MKLAFNFVVAACMAVASLGVHAGPGTGSATGNVTISDEGGFSWDLSLSSLYSVDASTGAVSLNTGLFTPGAEVADAQGGWSVTANTAQLRVYDAVSDSYLTPDQVLRWHSWVTADGNTQAVGSTTTSNNPWRSSFSFAVGGNIDPFIAYGFSARNTGSTTQTYTYSQGQDITPAISGPYTLYADVAGSLTNTTSPTATASITPVGSHLQTLRLGNGSTATVDAGVDVGAALSVSTSGTSPYGTFAATANGTGNYDYWSIGTTFRLSAGDVVALTGFAEITPVPEPGSLALMLAGLVGVAGVARRRSKV